MLNTTTLSLVDLNTTLVIVQLAKQYGNGKPKDKFKYNSCYCSTKSSITPYPHTDI
ncbi:hypothetical protein [Clostridium tetani]|uniref:hypothetical protein n=1 Tax=Clostridium tetani TaxID=1513 RepID=UPI003D1559C9